METLQLKDMKRLTAERVRFRDTHLQAMMDAKGQFPPLAHLKRQAPSSAGSSPVAARLFKVPPPRQWGRFTKAGTRRLLTAKGEVPATIITAKATQKIEAPETDATKLDKATEKTDSSATKLDKVTDKPEAESAKSPPAKEVQPKAAVTARPVTDTPTKVVDKQEKTAPEITPPKETEQRVEPEPEPAPVIKKVEAPEVIKAAGVKVGPSHQTMAHWAVQIASFRRQAEGEALAKRHRAKGRMVLVRKANRRWYAVLLLHPDRAAARRTLVQVRREGHKDAFLKRLRPP